MSEDAVEIRGGGLTARIARRGAELVRLQDGAGRDLLWDGDPAFWTGHAPLLFPIVGRVAGDRITVDGRDHPMRQHGLARLMDFEPVEADGSRCRWRLAASEATLAQYPFAFVLDATYALSERSLAVTAAVRNAGDRPMPAAFGFHPAFRWPLPGGSAREDCAVTFEHDEPAPIRRIEGGLVLPGPVPTPVEGRRLALHDGLFAHDALVFDRLTSRSVTYGGPQGLQVRVDFPGMPELGLWSKPGAGFVCIEPWHGTASPQGFEGEFSDKPGLVRIAPGETRTFAMKVAVLEG